VNSIVLLAVDKCSKIYWFIVQVSLWYSFTKSNVLVQRRTEPVTLSCWLVT